MSAAETPPPPQAAARVADVPPPDASAAQGPRSLAEQLPVGSELAQEKPEVLVAGAFIGAFLFARILKHVTSE